MFRSKIISIMAGTFFLLSKGLAAVPIHLETQHSNSAQRLFIQKLSKDYNEFRLIRSEKDFNCINHKYIQQYFHGIPIWDATAVFHETERNNKPDSIFVNQNNMIHANGIIYENVEGDLNDFSDATFSKEKKFHALEVAKKIYNDKSLIKNYERESVTPIIYLDQDDHAHYAFLVSFYVDDRKTGAHYPIMILDSISFKLFKKWDRVFTLDSTSQRIETPVGGIGGNQKIGEIIYDGNPGHAPFLIMQREIADPAKSEEGICYFANSKIKVEDVAYDSVVVAAECYRVDGQYNNVAWIDLDDNNRRWKYDEMNGGFSPSLDAFYAGSIITKMYEDWFNIPPLVEADGKTPMVLTLRTHYGRSFENAFWDGKQMTFGDGDKGFYPLTSLDVAAHEVSHGFTEQHSNLDASINQMAALHESFSDMASAAVEFYVTNKNSWMLGKNITKGEGALRYLDSPTKDGSSIDHLKDYTDDIDPHLAAGIFNKAFYLIATSPKWDTHKAFNVMVKANQHYWTSSMKTFLEAACGVIAATKDYQYDVNDVRVAFSQVGIDTVQCTI